MTALPHDPYQYEYNVVVAAMAVMYDAHKGQVDKVGQPFYGHPLRVAARLSHGHHSAVVAAALLHDVVEDTDTTLEALEAHFVGRVVWLVGALTRVPDESYKDYIERVIADGIDATAIKLADLHDNLDPARCFPGCESLDKRHAGALFRINEGRWPKSGDVLRMPRVGG